MQKDISLSRRSLLAAGATGAAVVATSAAEAASFGNPDEPAEGAVNVVNPRALTDPGPQNPDLANNMPAFLNPPPTDVNGMPQYWASFNLAPKRIQNGGWARQVTQDDFKIRRPSPLSTCASVRAVCVNFTGTSRRNGRS
jgi:oxalate decarboxylase